MFANGSQLLQPQTDSANQPLTLSSTKPDMAYIIRRVHSALGPTHRAVRLYFHGFCDVNDGNAVQFPHINVLPPEGNEEGIPAVLEMFRNDKSVMVSTDSSKIVRITIGNVYKPVLDTRLSSIKLTNVAQYNPNLAIDALESAAPVQAARRLYRMHQESQMVIEAIAPPLRGEPHLPASMRNLTVDQALDSIAERFHGAVVYGECENGDKSHTVGIRYAWFRSH